VLTLRDIEEWTSEEVCNVLGLTETNQRVLLHRARGRHEAAFERRLAKGWSEPFMLISCRHYVSLATDAREAPCRAGTGARFGFHGAICPDCRRYEKTMSATLEALRAATAEPPNEAREAELLAALRAASG
jgi:hypothetical protein